LPFKKIPLHIEKPLGSSEHKLKNEDTVYKSVAVILTLQIIIFESILTTLSQTSFFEAAGAVAIIGQSETP
jgi:hypothetical protein